MVYRRTTFVQPFRSGDIVFVEQVGYEAEWWFNWPGIVRELLKDGREVLVEFMGYGNTDNRTVAVPARALENLRDPAIILRTQRIASQARQTARSKTAKSLSKSVSTVSPANLLDEDDLDDEDGPCKLLN